MFKTMNCFEKDTHICQQTVEDKKIKVELTREQADAIKILKGSNTSMTEEIEFHISVREGYGNRWLNRYDSLNELTIEEFTIAVLVGYEVKKTPEEELYQYYTTHNNSFYQTDKTMAKGIKKALEILDIKVEGIN